MSPLSLSRGHNTAIRRATWLASLMAVAVFAPLAWAGDPMHTTTDAAASPVRLALATSTVPSASPTYYLEIAEYRKNDQDSEDNTNEFGGLLDHLQSWRSKMDWTYKKFGNLKQSCINQSQYCDVVGISEETTAVMVMFEIQVYITPAAHRSSHGSPMTEPLKCPFAEMHIPERECRNILMNRVVRGLTAMDITHPMPSGDK